jgi:YHS domain-containing protein
VAASPKAPPAVAKVREKPAPVAAIGEDPVCHMKVRITAETPRVTRDGKTLYFCSEMCRDELVAHPEAHLAAH